MLPYLHQSETTASQEDVSGRQVLATSTNWYDTCFNVARNPPLPSGKSERLDLCFLDSGRPTLSTNGGEPWVNAASRVALASTATRLY